MSLQVLQPTVRLVTAFLRALIRFLQRKDGDQVMECLNDLRSEIPKIFVFLIFTNSRDNFHTERNMHKPSMLKMLGS